MESISLFPDSEEDACSLLQGEHNGLMGVEEFLRSATGPIFDVRSPCEFTCGHIPGSINLPLFTDEERAIVGTTYKQRGHNAAVEVGLEAVGPKIGQMVKTIKEALKRARTTSCRVTCFRGGMRSRSVQWLCELLGFSTVRLDGGYKAFRRHVLATFDRPFSFIVLGGPTGSGKTRWLSCIKECGYQAIDLEALASHRGSAFGLLPGVSQPRTEHFENLLARDLWSMDPCKTIFVEDESRLIGTCAIPNGIVAQMDRAHLLWLQTTEEERLRHLVELYGSQPTEWLIACTQKLQRRLGGLRTQEVIRLIESGTVREAAQLLMGYYDQAYFHSRERHPREHTVVVPEELLSTIDRLFSNQTLRLKEMV
jgi:tRNA 2-selenouridine synthase